MSQRKTSRYDTDRMAETMFMERASRDDKRGDRTLQTLEARASYFKGVHDAIEFMTGMASAGVSQETISCMLAQMSAQTSDETLQFATTH